MDEEFDAAEANVANAERALDEYLVVAGKQAGGREGAVVYVSVHKDSHQLEVPQVLALSVQIANPSSHPEDWGNLQESQKLQIQYCGRLHGCIVSAVKRSSTVLQFLQCGGSAGDTLEV